jgi:O-antigen/teichoic acid export membrane protein
MLMMLSKGISHVCFLLIAVVLARSLDRADFGTFNQVWLVNKSLVPLFALGLPVSVYYFLPRLPEARRKGFILQTMAALAALSVPFAAAVYALADPLARYFGNPALGPHLRLFALYPLVSLPTLSVDAILIGLGRTSRAATFDVVSKLLMITAVAGAAALDRGLSVIFASLILYALAEAALGLFMVWRPLRRMPLQPSRAEFSAQLRYAAPYGVANLVAALNAYVDKVLIAVFYPPAVFALYAAGASEIPLAGVTSVPVLAVTMGELAGRFRGGDIDGVLHLWHQSMLKLALVVFGVGAFLMVFAEPVVTGLFSSTYAPSVWPFRIFLLFLPLRITVLDQVLASLGETRFIFTSHALALGVNVVLGSALMWSAGWLGPAIAATLTGYAYAALILTKIGARLEVAPVRLVPWPALGRIALVAALAGAGSAPIALLDVGPVAKLGVGLLVFGTIYVLGSLRVHALTRHDLEAVRAWVLMTSRSVMGRVELEGGAPK